VLEFGKSKLTVQRMEHERAAFDQEKMRVVEASAGLEKTVAESKEKIGSLETLNLEQADKNRALEVKIVGAEKARDDAVAEKERITQESETKDTEIKSLEEKVEELKATVDEFDRFMERVRDRKRPRTEE
jgi:predicted RNase H-like nuclease (RuvC/YqgF family)